LSHPGSRNRLANLFFRTLTPSRSRHLLLAERGHPKLDKEEPMMSPAFTNFVVGFIDNYHPAILNFLHLLSCTAERPMEWLMAVDFPKLCLGQLDKSGDEIIDSVLATLSDLVLQDSARFLNAVLTTPFVFCGRPTTLSCYLAALLRDPFSDVSNPCAQSILYIISQIFFVVPETNDPFLAFLDSCLYRMSVDTR
jgi:hypothetical protein